MKFTIELWGSHPDSGNDDHWTGFDFDDRQSADEALNNPHESEFADELRHISYLELCEVSKENGKEYVERLEVRSIDRKSSQPDNMEDWKHEISMQAGMGIGVNAYNDHMGY